MKRYAPNRTKSKEVLICICKDSGDCRTIRNINVDGKERPSCRP